MDTRIKAIITKLRQSLETLYGRRLAHLVLFGSQARGRKKPDSDIDILVVLRGEVNPFEEISTTGKITAELSLKYTTVISCTFISEDRYNTEQSPLLLNVRREGIPA